MNKFKMKRYERIKFYREIFHQIMISWFGMKSIKKKIDLYQWIMCTNALGESNTTRYLSPEKCFWTQT